MPRYQYAFDEDRQLVDVLMLSAEDAITRTGTFECVSCGQPLIAKVRGTKRVKHFAHKVTPHSVCSLETYLHRLAKLTFKESFDRCRREGQPFLVQLTHPTRCLRSTPAEAIACIGKTLYWNDLTQHYNTARLEYRDGGFIPDLLLTNDGANPSQKLYVEIRVTHPVTAAKVKSGVPILEVRIESEAPINDIRRACIPTGLLSVFNMTLPPVESPGAACHGCRPPIGQGRPTADQVSGTTFCVAFLVQGSRDHPRAIMRTGVRMTLERQWMQGASKPLYSRLEPCKDLATDGPWQMPLTCLTEMKECGILRVPRHCFLCRNAQHGRDPHSMGYSFRLTCKKHKWITCGDEAATRCRDFQALAVPLPVVQTSFALE